MTELSFLIPLLPLFAFTMIVFFTKKNEKLSSGLSITLILAAWAMSVWILIETIAAGGGARYEIFTHLTTFATINLEVGILVDPLTAIMLVVVTTVGSCVQIYSQGYMHGDPRYSRFFSYLSLFLFSMLGLVLANNFFMIFIFWELVGLTSYLLIGFWFEKKVAADAGKKAFITTRVGDLGFIVGLLLIGTYAGTFNYAEVFHNIHEGMIPAGILTAAAIFMFCGAVGKSAQFPLHVWLPDAMEGPTPVSALIHAATMVAAGVYLVARSMSVFVASADASMVVAIIGITTSFIAATIALTQNDIKRVLAYSTVSQLGYMIMALGLYGVDTAHGHHSPGFYAGTFHLMTHAFFKGLLFLGAGSVIHAVHTNDIREMGGLVKKMPITAWTFMAASVSIAGIPPFAGFFSKDEIVAAAASHPVFLVLTLAVAFMTAFYMWRLCFLTFWGKPRDEHRYEHAHESPKNMSYPLAFLGILAVGAGWVGIPGLPGISEFVYHHAPYHTHVDWGMMTMATIIAGSGILLAYFMYYKKVIDPAKIAEKIKPLYLFSLNKWYFDELYEAAILNPIMALGRFLWTFDAKVVDGAVNGTAWLTILFSKIKQWIDTWIVDGAVNGAGWIVRQGAAGLKLLQAGRPQFYILFIFTVIVLAAIPRLLVDSAWPIWFMAVLVGVAILGLISRGTGTEEENADALETEK